MLKIKKSKKNIQIMLTELQKNTLTNTIYNCLKEGLFENFFQENAFNEKREERVHHIHHHNSSEHSHKDSSGNKHTTKRGQVMKWLDSAQQLHSELAYHLWPEMDEDEARSLFSKKYRGEDANGNSYSFDDDDVNKLYNMKDRFIDEIS